MHRFVSTPLIELPGCPEMVAEFVRRALDAVRTSTGVGLEFDSDTLPLIDHYVREVPSKSPDTAALIAAMVGSYYGETVCQTMGGTWKVETNDPQQWRVVLPGGLSFAPVPLALSAILEDESGMGDPDFQAVPALMVELERVMEGMGTVTRYEYFSLSCRYDTLEHLQESLLALASDRKEKSTSNLPN